MSFWTFSSFAEASIGWPGFDASDRGDGCFSLREASGRPLISVTESSSNSASNNDNSSSSSASSAPALSDASPAQTHAQSQLYHDPKAGRYSSDSNSPPSLVQLGHDLCLITTSQIELCTKVSDTSRSRTICTHVQPKKTENRRRRYLGQSEFHVAVRWLHPPHPGTFESQPR